MADTTSDLEQQLLESPAARARVLAQALETMEGGGGNGVTQENYNALVGANIADAQSFMGTLKASTVVVAIASAGQRGIGNRGTQAYTISQAVIGERGSLTGAGTRASTVVIAIASAGDRGSLTGAGTRASTVVIAIASAGDRGSLTGAGTRASTVVIAIASAGDRGSLTGAGTRASTVVIAIASAGDRGSLTGAGTRASTVVIAIASAGGRAAGLGGLSSIGTRASTVVIAIASAGGRAAGLGAIRGGFESTGAQASPGEIANALRQLADLVETGGGAPGPESAELTAAAEAMVAEAQQLSESAHELAASGQEMASSAEQELNADPGKGG